MSAALCQPTVQKPAFKRVAVVEPKTGDVHIIIIKFMASRFEWNQSSIYGKQWLERCQLTKSLTVKVCNNASLGEIY